MLGFLNCAKTGGEKKQKNFEAHSSPSLEFARVVMGHKVGDYFK